MHFAALDKITEKISDSFALKILFVVLAYLSYSIPMIYAYFESVNFMYVNAWDEETYLSYQGALGSLTVPGYWASGAVVYVLQNFGLSGGEINIIFDCLLTPATFFLLVYIIRRMGVEQGRALIYAAMILFSPILFNFGNPLISHLTRDYGLLGYGWEYYQSALRTPEPQLSYFFVVLAVAAYLKTRRMVFLIVPLPLLYFYVGISYAYFLVCGVALLHSRFFNNKLSFFRIGLACVASYLAMSFGFVIFDVLLLSRDPFINAMPDAYIKSHAPILPISGILSGCLLLIQLALGCLQSIKDQKHAQAQFFIMLSLLFVCNVHVISGVMLSYKNYIDYSTCLVAGVGIVIFLDFLRCHSIKGARFVFFFAAALILYLTFKAYGFSFSKLEYKYFRGLQFNSAQEYKAAVKDPMSLVIQDSDLSAKLPYSVSKMPVPMFSYQYNFPLVANGCRVVLDRMEAVTHMLKNDVGNNSKSSIDYFEASIKSFSGQKYVPLDLQKYFPLNRICKDMKLDGSIRVLPNQFKDDGWVTLKLFRWHN